MKQPINKPALRKAGGPAKNPPVKTTGASIPKAASKSSVFPSDRKWEIESAMNTLVRAEELKRDPKFMRDVKNLAAEQAAKLKKIC